MRDESGSTEKTAEKLMLAREQKLAYARAEGITKSVIGTIVLMGLIALAFGFVSGFFTGTDDTDLSRHARSGMALYTDYGTGCQYLSTPAKGNLIPRLDATGQHLCITLPVER